MTGQDLLSSALALILSDSKDNPDYVRHAVPLINILLAETFEINNSMRVSASLVPLDEIPFISALSDTVPFETELIVNALTNGLAAKLLVDDDTRQAVYFQNQYVAAVRACDRALCSPVTDCYGN